MKKFLALLLAALMVLAMFTACAKTETPSGRNHRSYRNCGTRRSRGRNSG